MYLLINNIYFLCETICAATFLQDSMDEEILSQWDFPGKIKDIIIIVKNTARCAFKEK